jgi:NCS2 family nucleobase:cation symporter-2
MATKEQLRDPNYMPPITSAVPLGIQHILAMFVSNVTPAIIVAGAAGFGFGKPDMGQMIYMIQMCMFFAGIATLIQTVGLGPIGAKLPIVQGTSFAFIPVMIPIVAGGGVDAMAGLMGGIVAGGIFHIFLGTIISRIRSMLPPLITGLIVLMIGLALIKVGIQYAAGGVPAIGKPEFGSLGNWAMAGVVIVVTLYLKFFTKGMLSMAATILGLLAGYLLAFGMGEVNFGNIDKAAWLVVPNPLHFGIEFNAAAVIGMCLMGIISAIETVGDVSGITKGGAGREATDKEITGATYADGLGTTIAGVFGGLPNTSFSQNVGLVAMTGMMSRHVVTFGAIFLVICGLVPKVGAIISTIPIEVLGGGVIVMFGMVAAAGVNMLSAVAWDRRSMLIFAISLSIGLGLQLVPEALQHAPQTVKVLMTSGLLPAAFIAILLNQVLPEID